MGIPDSLIKKWMDYQRMGCKGDLGSFLRFLRSSSSYDEFDNYSLPEKLAIWGDDYYAAKRRRKDGA